MSIQPETGEKHASKSLGTLLLVRNPDNRPNRPHWPFADTPVEGFPVDSISAHGHPAANCDFIYHSCRTSYLKLAWAVPDRACMVSRGFFKTLQSQIILGYISCGVSPLATNKTALPMFLGVDSLLITTNETLLWFLCPDCQWRPEPDTRGTFSILSICLSTLVIALWNAVHVDILRHPSSSQHTLIKLRTFVGALLAPGGLLLLAILQRSTAKKLVNEAAERFTFVTTPQSAKPAFSARLRMKYDALLRFIGFRSSVR